MASITDDSLPNNVSQVTSPTLLIAGSEDEELKETARVLPDCRLVSIEVGHWIQETEPERFVEAIRSFLGSLEGNARWNLLGVMSCSSSMAR